MWNGLLKWLLKEFRSVLYKGHLGTVRTCAFERSLSWQNFFCFLESSSLFVNFQILELLTACVKKKTSFLTSQDTNKVTMHANWDTWTECTLVKDLL